MSQQKIAEMFQRKKIVTQYNQSAKFNRKSVSRNHRYPETWKCERASARAEKAIKLKWMNKNTNRDK